MIINHNIASLNAWQNLNNTNNELNRSLERLSSGLRINRAADDAAGLAISEKMRAQINGLTQAISNAQNGISLLQTAEGALSTSQNILQRMRQLAVSASADSANASDRQQMQKEMDQLAQELSRISNTTEFNTKNVLGGAFTNQTFQIGANAGQTVSVDISAMDAYSLGVTAGTGVTVADGNLFTSGQLNAGATATTQAYQVGGTVTAAAKAAVTNNQSAVTAVYTLTLTGGNNLTLTANSAGAAANGITLATDTTAGAGDPTADYASGVITLHLSTTAANNTDTKISAALTAIQATMGMTVTGAVAGTQVTAQSLAQTTTGYDAAAITFTAAAAGAGGTGTTIHWTTGGGATTSSYDSGTDTVTVNVKTGGDTVTNILAAVNNNTTVSAVVKASSSTTGSVAWNPGALPADATTAGGADATATYNLLDANGATVESGVTASSGAVTFSNGLRLSLDATVLNSLPSGTFTTQTIDVVAANSAAAQAGTNGVLNAQATVSKGVLIDTRDNAQSAISAIDSALNKVSTSRATLGSVQNRLDNTVANLGITSQNMTAAESRIRDADMALEMANFTRQQILMQAGTAMLAQANQVPQSTLQLLRG